MYIIHILKLDTECSPVINLNQPSESDIDPDKSSSTATSSTPTTKLFERCEAILQDSYKKLAKLDQLLREPTPQGL